MATVTQVAALTAENTALRARVAQLEAALRGLLPMVDCPEQFAGAVDAARAALAASPDDKE